MGPSDDVSASMRRCRSVSIASSGQRVLAVLERLGVGPGLQDLPEPGDDDRHVVVAAGLVGALD